jgi:hypothetical protein
MKETDDKAMELLLRRHAQRNPRASNGHGTVSEASSAHLDADEMNALAENALPPAARARYFSHLADCGSCRKLATELAVSAARAAGSVNESARGVSQRGTFWQMLATFISLPVMRYGVPVLAMLILVVIGVVVLRSGPRNEMVALKNEGTPVEEQLQPTTAGTPPAQTQAAPQTPVRQDSVQSKELGAGTGLPKDQPKTETAKSGNFVYDGAANRQQPGFAPEPNVAPSQSTEAFKNAPTSALPLPAAKAEARDEVTLADKSRADDRLYKRGEADKKEEQQISQRSVTALPRAKFGGLANESKEKGGPRRSREQSESEGRSSGSASTQSSETSVQTRDVGGHRFRREGNTWVDAVYDSSRAVRTLTRGSEQYRKLVNDNPGLGAIVNQLGSVIVVWNGTQYRIH